MKILEFFGRQRVSEIDHVNPTKVHLAIWAVITIVLLYLDVLHWMVGRWSRDPGQQHGFLIPFVAIWIGFAGFSKTTLPQEEDGPLVYMAGVAIVLIALVLRLLGIAFSITTVELATIPPVLFGLAWICFSRSVALRASPGILFLFFMIPLPGVIAAVVRSGLQSISTAASVFTLQLLGYPAVAEGNVIHLAEDSIGVAEACSGIRMFTAFVAIAVAYCLIARPRSIFRPFILLASVPISILANVMRVTLMGVASEQLDRGLTWHLAHDLSGWAMLALGLALFALMSWIFGQLFEFEPSD
ncbi:MAG: exosortase/archaeosortase family protein [Planctomycetota bacterium]